MCPTEDRRPAGDDRHNPVSGAQVPVWIADYVLMGYGSGAVMGVPAHDQRDFEFARAFDLPIIQVIRPEGEEASDPATWEAAKHARGRDRQQRRAGRRASGRGHCAGDQADRGEGRGQGGGDLPAARLADQPPALLGRADPYRLLPGAWDGARSRGAVAGAAARSGRVQADGRVAAALRAGVLRDDLPDLWWSGEARDRHDGHVHLLVVVLPALRRPARTRTRRGRRRSWRSGCRWICTSAGRSTRRCT